MQISRINMGTNQNFGAKLSQDTKTLLYEKGLCYSSYHDELKEIVEMLKNISPKGTIEVKDEYISTFVFGGGDAHELHPIKVFYLKENDNLPLRKIASVDELNSKRVYEFLDSLKEGIKEFIEMSKKTEYKEKDKKLINILG